MWQEFASSKASCRNNPIINIQLRLPTDQMQSRFLCGHSATHIVGWAEVRERENLYVALLLATELQTIHVFCSS